MLEQIEIQSVGIDKLSTSLSELHKNKEEQLNLKDVLKKAVFQPTKAGSKEYEHEWAELKPLLHKVNPLLAENNLSICGTFYGDYIVLTLMHTSGQFIRSIVKAFKEGDKSQYKSSQTTMIRRVMVMNLLNIDDGTSDDDGASAEGILEAKNHNEMASKSGEHSVKKATGNATLTLPATNNIPRPKDEIRKIKAHLGDLMKLFTFDKDKYQNITKFIENAPLIVLDAEYRKAKILQNQKK